MNTASPVSRPRRKLWPWILLTVVGLPFLAVVAVAASFLTLDRDAAVLRRHVLKATGANCETKVQVSVGRMSFCALRAGLGFVQNDKIDEAKLALRAVRSASVGVYQLEHRRDDWTRAELMNDTDASMSRRGWVRAVGVNKGPELVMVYFREGAEEPEEVCVAVLNRRELVVVSAVLEPDAIVELVEQHAGDKLAFGRALRMAQN